MGACGTRTKEVYSSTATYITEKKKDAAIAYAPQLEQARRNYIKNMDYMWNYRNEAIEDEGPLAFITEFEKTLPLREISLVEFERRIKKLVVPSMGESVTVAVV
jgi:hypothetical protein